MRVLVASSWTWPVTRRSGTSRTRVKLRVPSTVSSFTIWENRATRCLSSRCTRRRSSATCPFRSVSSSSPTPSYACWNSITIASTPFWIGETFSTWKWIPIPPTCLWRATRWKSWSSPARGPSLPPSSTSGFPATTRRSTPPTKSANRTFSKWNGKETVLWVSIVRPTAAGARRATKPAARVSARNSTTPRKSPKIDKCVEEKCIFNNPIYYGKIVACFGRKWTFKFNEGRFSY